MSAVISTRWYFSDWMSDEGVRACSLAARGLWMDLICIAGANEGAEHGYVLIAGKVPSTEQLARRVGTLRKVIEPLLRELEENRVYSRDRRGAIYCRRMVRAEKSRGNGRLGTQRKSLDDNENKKQVGGETEPEGKNTCTFTSLPSEETPWPPDYREQFWREYPRRTEKAAAMAKLEAIAKSGRVPWALLMAGLRRYAAHLRAHRTEARYVKHPTTWLNRGCWDDEHAPPNGDGQLNLGGEHAANRSGGVGGYSAIAARLRLRAGAAAAPGSDRAAVRPVDRS